MVAEGYLVRPDEWPIGARLTVVGALVGGLLFACGKAPKTPMSDSGANWGHHGRRGDGSSGTSMEQLHVSPDQHHGAGDTVMAVGHFAGTELSFPVPAGMAQPGNQMAPVTGAEL